MSVVLIITMLTDKGNRVDTSSPESNHVHSDVGKELKSIANELSEIRKQLPFQEPVNIPTKPIPSHQTGHDSTELNPIVNVLSEIRDKIPSQASAPVTIDTESHALSFWSYIVILVLAVILIWILSYQEESKWVKRAKLAVIISSAISAIIATVAIALTLLTGKDNLLDIINLFREQETNIISVVTVIKAPSARPIKFAMDNQTSADSPKPDKTHLAFIIPFQDEASCNVNSKPTSWKGTKPDQAHKLFIQQLGNLLRQCGTPAIPARVRVLGFASSSRVANPGSCKKARSSEEANLIIAEARRINVTSLLGKCIQEKKCNDDISRECQCNWLKIESKPWESFEKMEKARKYNDRILEKSNLYSKERGLLNRRVDIQLIDLSNCEIQNFAKIKIPGNKSNLDTSSK